jgi:hypothetical protein
MFVGLPGLALALGVGVAAHAQEDPARPLGRCGDVMPRTATPSRAAIVFNYASDQLDPISRPAIDSMIEQGVAGNHVCVEVHTAQRGDAAQNLTLSRARAWAVLTALREGGVSEVHATAYGRGEAEPIDPDDRTNARVIVWTWAESKATGLVANASAPTRTGPALNPAHQAAIDTLLARLPVAASDPDVVAALAALGSPQAATFGETYERRYPSAGVSIVVSREGVVDRVREYGRLGDTRVNGYTLEAPSYMSELSSTWTGSMPSGLGWGAPTQDVVAALGDDAVCVWYSNDFHALIYPALGLTAVIQPFGTGARADCRGRLAVLEYGQRTAPPPTRIDIDTLGQIAGLQVEDLRTETALGLLGPYARVGQPPTWVFRQAGVEVNGFDGLIRDVAVFAKVPGRPVLTGLWPWTGAAPFGLTWGASATEVARAVGHPLSCDVFMRSVGGETRFAPVSPTEQALFLLDKALFEDPAAVRARAPRGSCEGARLVGWRFLAQAP